MYNYPIFPTEYPGITNRIKNSGLILEAPNEKDHLVGGVTVGGFQVNKPEAPVIFNTGHGWHDVVTKNDGEVQANRHFDSFSCTVFTTLKALIKYIKCAYGEDIDLSESFTAVMSGVIPGRGNTVRNVLESVRNHGVLKEEYRPFTKDTTQAEFFSAVTAIQKTKALEWLNRYDIWWDLLDSSDNVPHEKIIENLKYTPIIATGFAWASYYGNSGVFYDYNNTANHCFLIDDWKDDGSTADLLVNDSYRFDWNVDDPDHTELNEFVKPLSKGYRVWSAHRIYATRKGQKKTSFLNLYIKSMENFYYYWDTTHLTHNFFYIGIPSGEDKKYRQHIDLNECDTPTKFLFIALRKSMNQSSWAEVSKYPDISTINKKFA